VFLGIASHHVRLTDKWAVAVAGGTYQFMKFPHMSSILSQIMYYWAQFNILYIISV